MDKFEADIKTFDDVLAVVESAEAALDRTGHNLWWRGQAEEEWGLVPRVLRREDVMRDELAFAERFRRKAPPRLTPVPEPADDVAWLILMQHYHVPTRLLDWTESALVALYFVTCDLRRDDRAGTLSVLNAQRLNEYHAELTGVPSSKNHFVRDTIRTYYREKTRGKDAAKPPPEVVAFHPVEWESRMMMQQTTFTVHRDSTSMHELEQHDYFLRVFRVLAEAKDTLRRRLFQFGVRRSVLFPDAANLGAEISQMSFRHS